MQVIFIAESMKDKFCILFFGFVFRIIIGRGAEIIDHLLNQHFFDINVKA